MSGNGSPWTTATASRSPPGSSKAQHDSSSRTGWTSPARGGPPLAPKPSCTCAPSSPTATSTSTGNGTNSKNSAATTSTTTNNSILQPDPQLTAEEPHPTETAQSCSPKLLTLSGRQSSGQRSGIVITS